MISFLYSEPTVNVPVPFKKVYLEELGQVNSFSKSGSVNLILFKEDNTIGYSTDYLAALKLINSLKKTFLI
jgi:shikimate 5-dehydrogenase